MRRRDRFEREQKERELKAQADLEALLAQSSNRLGRRRRNVQLDNSENHQRGQVDASCQPLPKWCSTAVENNKTKAGKSKKVNVSAANKGKGKASTNTGIPTGAGAGLFGRTSSNIKTPTPAAVGDTRGIVPGPSKNSYDDEFPALG
jgi:hypothetical protein